jgi:hypothetical protein
MPGDVASSGAHRIGQLAANPFCLYLPNKRLIEYRQLLLGSLQIHRHNVTLPTVKDD